MIEILDEITINQIAAGEVIENAASVVKELIENAIDANAKMIFLETQGAGRALIRVVDDGVGIKKEDLPLAVERHATSKIKSVHDLEVLNTLGFRGEALASIASISRMKIQSCVEGEVGYEMEIVGGQRGKITPSPRSRGTTIEVYALFYNVPVRKKFQKSLSSEAAEIHKTLTKIALSYPHLSLSWKHDEHMKFSLHPFQSYKERMALLLGEEFASHMIQVKEIGYISTPSFHRPNRTGQYLAINGRPVLSSFISHIVQRAYHSALPEGRFPLFILSLRIDPSLIDVNVHPQKKELRFREEKEIERELFSEVSQALQSFFRPLPPRALPQEEKREISCPPLKISPEKSHALHDVKLVPAALHKVLGVMGGYILVQEEEFLRLYDIEAIDYRLHFDKIVEKGAECQMLLLPQTIEVSESERLYLADHLEELQRVGISLRPFGVKTFLVEALSPHLEIEDVKSLLGELVGEEYMTLVHKVAKRKRRQKVTPEQAVFLLDRLEKSGDPLKTPEGKPISLLITLQEVKKRFG